MPYLAVAIGQTGRMRCRMGRVLPAVAQCENWAVSRIFYWPITTMSAMRMPWRVFSPLARGLVGSTVRAKTARLSARPALPLIHRRCTRLELGNRWFRSAANIPRAIVISGDGNRASDDQLPVRMGVCEPCWERVSCVHRDVRAARGALERMTRPERAARPLVCYPLRVALRSPPRGG